MLMQIPHERRMLERGGELLEAARIQELKLSHSKLSHSRGWSAEVELSAKVELKLSHSRGWSAAPAPSLVKHETIPRFSL